MARKYADIKLNYCSRYKSFSEIPPDDIIFFAHYFDMNYDRSSEDMGHFITVAYIDGDDVSATEFNPGEWRPIKEFIEKVGNNFAEANYSDTLFNYFNKRILPDLRVENGALIYKDEFRFTEDNMHQTLRANLDNLEKKYYLPKWSEGALSKKE